MWWTHSLSGRCAFVVLASAIALHSTVDAQEGRIVVTGGVRGRFVTPRCAGDVTLEASEEAQQLSALGDVGADTVVVDAGGLLAPHGVARFAARDRPDALVRLTRELGVHALALGEDDVSAPRERTLEVLRLHAADGRPYLATNLSCGEAAGPLCDAVLDREDPPWLSRAGGLRVAVGAFLDPGVVHRVAEDRSAGLDIEPIATAVPSFVRAARAAGAELIAVVVDTSAAEALEWVEALPEDVRPDLAVLAAEGDSLLFARPASVRPALAAPPPGRALALTVSRSESIVGGFEMLATPLAAPPEVNGAVRRFIETMGPLYCAALGEALPGGRLDAPLEARDMANLAANLVREAVGADVALFNTDAIERRFRSARPEALTRSDLYIAIEYDEPLVVAEVPATWLDAVQLRAAAHAVATPGLERDDQVLEVRGRPVLSDVTYRVVTLRFLARGGDDALPALPPGVEWRDVPAPGGDSARLLTLRDVVEHALVEPSTADPRRRVASAGDAPEWLLRGALTGDFAGSTVQNTAGYDAAALGVESTVAMGLDLDVAVNFGAPQYSVETRLQAAYRGQWSPSTAAGEAGSFVEATDRAALRLLGSYRGLRAAATGWVPDLYIELFVESEFSRPAARDWHWLLLRPTAGIRFPWTTQLEARLQVGVQGQALQPGAEADLGAGASLLLQPLDVLVAEGRALRVEGGADFFAFDLFDRNDWQLRSSIGASLEILAHFSVTVGATLFAQQESAGLISTAFGATAGVRIGGALRAVSEPTRYRSP